MGRLLFFVALVSLVCPLQAQEDNVGPGRALLLDGVTEYIDLGNRYDDIELPVTISAWIYLSSAVTDWAPVFVSQDNANLYNGFWLIVQPGLVGIGYGDGQGENLPLYRRSKTASVPDISERWVQVTGVIRDKLDMDIYVNGVNAGGNYSGSSDLPMSGTPGDVAKIGRWHSNGLTFHFKGMVDEVRLWERGLSQAEVRRLLCRKVQSTENGLVGNWTFNEIDGTSIRDKSPNGFDGILIDGQRIWSGAPIGDDSDYLYTSSWGQENVSSVNAQDSITVTNISGAPSGVHVYRVLEPPSRTDGIANGCSANFYFGVFTDSYNTGIGYDLHYNLRSAGDITQPLYFRADNATVPWNQEANGNDQVYRGEYIRTGSSNVELGDNIVACDKAEVLLDPGPGAGSGTVLWNTGATTPTLRVTATGTYAVTVENECGTLVDEIHVLFGTSPPDFNIQTGDDNLCTTDEIILSPSEDLGTYDIVWNDGSVSSSLKVSQPGTYTLKASNLCGERMSSATVGYSPVELVFIPNVITPGTDALNQTFQIKSVKGPVRLTIFNRWGGIVYRSADYQSDWDGKTLPSGVYYYQVSGGCIGERKGSVSILRH